MKSEQEIRQAIELIEYTIDRIAPANASFQEGELRKVRDILHWVLDTKSADQTPFTLLMAQLAAARRFFSQARNKEHN